MKRIQLHPGLHFWLHGREYVIKQRLAAGELQICDLVTETLSKISETALIQCLFRGELEIDVPQINNKSRNHNYLQADFTQIPENIRVEAKRKYAYISRVIELDLPALTPASLSPVIETVSAEISDTKPPNWLTVYRWLKTYSQAGQDIRALVPRHLSKGDYRPKLDKEVLPIIDRAIKSTYLSPSQPNVADTYDEIVRQIIHENQIREVTGQNKLNIPHRSTIYRMVSKLEPLTVATGRYGKRIASQMYDPVLLGPQTARPLERVEIDHTKLPLFVVDTENRMPIGRPWLTSAVDKYSGITLGYYLSFEPPSYLSVMQCLLHLIRPKNYLHNQYSSVENTWDTYGLPEVIVVDNGKEFYSTHFEDACLQLGIVIQYCPPKMPWYKSAIERYFGALNTQLLSEQPGKSFANFMQKYDYDPLKNAVISFAALQEILHIFIVDIHNQSSHPELKSPRAQVWSKAIAIFPPAVPASHQDLKVLIGNITTRKISRRGVELFGLIYNNAELASLRSAGKLVQKTTVKYDPSDLSRIYIFNSITHQFQAVPALNQEYTKDLTLWQHQVIKQLARQESEQVDIVALALAKEKIQRIVERESSLSPKSKTRTTIARWKGIGKNNFNSSQGESSQQPQECYSSVEIVSNSHSTSGNDTNIMAGISELGSAFTPELISYQVNDSAAETEIMVDSTTVNREVKPIDCSSTSSTTLSPRQGSATKNRTTRVQQEISSCAEETMEWQPDLTGWDVSIGLPSGEST